MSKLEQFASGALVHGRHVQTQNWERLVWGDPKANRLGSLPTLARVILEESKDRPITTIVMGTGASERDGRKEAEVMKGFLLDNFDKLGQFPTFREHIGLQTVAARDILEGRLHHIITETTSQNTDQEVAAAAKVFAEHGVTFVSQITAASHAPRSMLVQSAAREAGAIPADQRWSLVADDMTFGDGPVRDVTVLEPPHRGDDPAIGWQQTYNQAAKGYFGLSQEGQQGLIAMIDSYVQAQHEQH